VHASEPGALALTGAYVAEYSKVTRGGVRTADSFRHLLTLDVTADLDPILGREAGTMFMQMLTVNAEKGGSADTGDLQAYTNIENDRSLTVLYEWWIERAVWDDRLRLKFGKVDANTEFASIESAGEFAHSSAGYSPTLFVFPSYPDSAMSVNLFFDLVESESHEITLKYGLYDGSAAVDGVPTGSRGPSTFFSDDRSDDYFHITEMTWIALDTYTNPIVTVSVGGWHHTAEFDTFNGGREDGTSGLYLTLEWRLVNGEPSDGDTGWYLFGQYGWADESVSEVSQHVGLGVMARGMLAGRAQDSAGIYMSLADLSDDPAAGFPENELALEFYYRMGLKQGRFLQPGLVWVRHPGGNPALDNALVAVLRAGVEF